MVAVVVAAAVVVGGVAAAAVVAVAVGVVPPTPGLAARCPPSGNTCATRGSLGNCADSTLNPKP